jgi:hypothetical protein
MNLYRELHVDSRKRTADAKNKKEKSCVMNLKWFLPFLYKFAVNVLPLRTFNERNPIMCTPYNLKEFALYRTNLG